MIKLKAVLGIKVNGKDRVRKYRIQSDTNEMRDIPIAKIKEVMQKGITISGIIFDNNEIIETTEIKKIPELGESSISLQDWCMQSGERGQRILTEFNNGDNFPIFAKDISAHSLYKAQFGCTVCNRINIQTVNSKTGKVDSKCKYCSGQEVSDKNSLLSWCNTHGNYGAQLLNEFIAGDNDFTPNKVSYASAKYVNFKCSKCGNINRQQINWKTMKNRGCKYCNTHNTSFGEQLISLWLQSQGLEAYNQYKFRTPIGDKEFDIYLPQLNLCIEHQSSRHAPIEKRICDDSTELIAQQLGLSLLEVCQIDSRYPRTENQWCITYKYAHELEMIQKISLWLNTNYNLNTNPNYTRALEDQAYLNSYKVVYEQSLQFKNPTFLSEWNQQFNGSVTPDKVALNSPRKYYWTCLVCGHTYLATPNSRNQGKSCPNWRNHPKH